MMVPYHIANSEIAMQALDAISCRLCRNPQTERCSQEGLRIVSMKESFDLELLTRFYNELMIPNFPLEEERDDLDDWVYCLDPSKNHNEGVQLYPSMDILLLLSEEPRGESGRRLNTRTTIVAGVAFEYYRQAHCGLLSYMVVSDNFRRLGIMGSLHPVACHAIHLLHQENSYEVASRASSKTNCGGTLKAIFAETNTFDAGDAPPAQIRKRHEILYQLGYRQLKFPYIQPALAEDAESFDEIMLLMHCPRDDDNSHTGNVDTQILHDYVVDFFQSVTGYDNDSYKGHWYYELVDWFRNEYPQTPVTPDLPWNDVKQEMRDRMIRSSSDRPVEPQFKANENHVVVVGAGIAGLVATVTLAEEYLQQDPRKLPPLTITLMEAHPFVGGRIRTVITTNTDTADSDQNKFMFTNDRLSSCQKVDGFAPWPIPIGAEFVHGVDSMANHLIEDHDDWVVQETFDLCGSSEEYPSRNSFVRRRSSLSLSEEQRQQPHVFIFMDGKCYPLRENHGCYELSNPSTSNPVQSKTQRLIQHANSIWQTLQCISERVDEESKNVGRDMSLDEFVEEQLCQERDDVTIDDISKIKNILESLFSNTAGSANRFLGIHEASREEWNWEYTESNFRSEQCFNEFIQYYLNRIDNINEQAEASDRSIRIKLVVESPVREIGTSRPHNSDNDRDFGQGPIRVLTDKGITFDCNRCIVTVPLGVLKAKMIKFRDDYSLPPKTQEAIDTINMFSGMKAHMLVKVGVDIGQISKRMRNTELIFCPGEIFSQIWIRRNDDSVLLTGFCVANCRDQLLEIVRKNGKQSKSQIAQELLMDQVSLIFKPHGDEEASFLDPSNPTCSSFALHDWSEDEFIRGIYSSPSIGAGWMNSGRRDKTPPPTHRDHLAEPIKNRIWFAGEHANIVTCATVQSAMESGAKAAKEVHQALQSI